MDMTYGSGAGSLFAGLARKTASICPICNQPGGPTAPIRPGSLISIHSRIIGGLEIPGDHANCIELAFQREEQSHGTQMPGL